MKLIWNAADQVLAQLPKGAGQLSMHLHRPMIEGREHNRTLMTLTPHKLTLYMPEKTELTMEGLESAAAQHNELILIYDDGTCIRAHAGSYANQIAQLLDGLLKDEPATSPYKSDELSHDEAVREHQSGKTYIDEEQKKADKLTADQYYEQSRNYAELDDRKSEWESLEKAASLGSDKAHYQMATYLATGMHGQTASPEQAYAHMESAARLGNKEANYYLANWLRQGFGTEKNPEKAILFYQQDDSPKSLVQLAILYGDELGDTDKAIRTANKALNATLINKTRQILKRKLEMWSEPGEEKAILNANKNYHDHITISIPTRVTAADLMDQAKGYAQVEDRESEWNALVRAAELSHPQAHFQLATYLASGMYGHPVVPGEAYEHMSDAADLGNKDAAYYLGAWNRQGFGTEKDLAQAEFWLKKDASPKAKAQLALLYGDDMRDYEKAIKLADEIINETKVAHTRKVMSAKKAKWQAAIDEQKKAAGKQLRIAHILNDAGEHELAAEFLEKAAPYSNEARYLLGLLYLKGQGVPVDKEKAKTYFEASKDIQPESLYYLTYLEEDPKKQQEYANAYLKSATNKNRIGQVNNLLHPKNAEQLRKEGIERIKAGDESGTDLLEQAADMGDSDAMIILAEALFETDPKKSVELLNKAAEEHIPDAYALLGYAAANGLGMERDPWKAQWLLQKALANESQIARQWISER